MLNDLRHYSNLGTPDYFFQLISEIRNDNAIWTTKDIQKFSYNRIIDGRVVFDGCIDFALNIGLLEVENGRINISIKIKDYLNSINQLSDRIIELFFIWLKQEEQFYNIFSSRHLNYDVIYQSPQISYAAFSFKYANIKQLLLDFGFIELHPVEQFNCFIVHSRYHRLFDKLLLPDIKKRRIGLNELEKKLELQKINGEQAEQFVLKFEANRLSHKKEIQWVAQYISNQGYDIASFNNVNDENFNRFIEVKSYEGEIPYFYWSRNEYLVAKVKKGNYWLYLVDRKQTENPGYNPIMVQNPYENVLQNKNWDKTIEKYKVTWLPNE